MTRVTLCAYDYPSMGSGPASWAQRIPERLKRSGIDVEFRLFHWKEKKDGTLYRHLTSEGLRIQCIPFLDAASNQHALLESFCKSPPEVVVADNVIPAHHAARYLRLHGTRVISTLRSDDNFYEAVTDLFVNGSAESRVDSVVAVSQFLGNRCIAGGFPAEQVSVIPSGAIPGDLSRRKQRAIDQKFRVTYVGRLAEEQKRILATTECMISLCRRDSRFVGTIVGDGPNRQQVEQMVAKADVPIEVVGAMSSDSVQKILLNSDMSLLLSDYEGLPTAVVEAMGCGVVPVCLKIRSGIGELIEDGVNGFLTADRAEGVFRAARMLADDPQRAAGMGRLGYERIVKDFQSDVCAARWVELLEREAGKSRPVAFEVPKQLQLPAHEPRFGNEDVRRAVSVESGLQRWRRAYLEMRRRLRGN